MAKNQKQESKRGRGRPNKFDGNPRLRKAVAKFVQEVGKLGPARERLATEGVAYQPAPGKPKVVQIVDISLPTLSAVARVEGVELKRGRPAVAA
jgi:hypothetical protein